MIDPQQPNDSRLPQSEQAVRSSGLLDAPCLFCGYNGPGYWQVWTHRKECPWYESGGWFEREHALRGVIQRLYRENQA